MSIRTKTILLFLFVSTVFSLTSFTFAQTTVTFGESGSETYSNVTVDSYISNFAQTTNYGNNSELLVHPGSVIKTLFRFDLSQIPSNAFPLCAVNSAGDAWAACAKLFTDNTKAYCVDSRGVKEEASVAACSNTGAIIINNKCP